MRHPSLAHLLLLLIFNQRRVWSVGGGEVVCRHLPGLTRGQRAVCRMAPDSIVPLVEGARVARAECHRRFANHRWNCSNIGRINPLGPIVVVGSREAAVTWALWSAGAAWAVSAACARGVISGCGCERRGSAAVWKWAGCSVDLSTGLTLARRFLDAREVERDSRSLMNLHNNRAGRTAVKGSIVGECKCHGVSGSCTMKSCWKALPPFSAVSERLMSRYRRARAVAATERGLMLRAASRPPPKADLVYLHPSPDYCEPDPVLGSLGTHHRLCNTSSKGVDGCEVLCCGRGYNTQQVVKKWQCNCKFHWCCYVKCDTCVEKREQYTCK